MIPMSNSGLALTMKRVNSMDHVASGDEKPKQFEKRIEGLKENCDA